MHVLEKVIYNVYVWISCVTDNKNLTPKNSTVDRKGNILDVVKECWTKFYQNLIPSVLLYINNILRTILRKFIRKFKFCVGQISWNQLFMLWMSIQQHTVMYTQFYFFLLCNSVKIHLKWLFSSTKGKFSIESSISF